MNPETEEFQALLDLCNQVCDAPGCTHLVNPTYRAWCSCCIVGNCEIASADQLAAKRTVNTHYDDRAAEWKEKNYGF